MSPERERVVPHQAATEDPITRLLDKVDLVLKILGGHHDDNGVHHPGLSARVARLEAIVRWGFGIFTAAVISVVAAWASYGGGPPRSHP